MTTEEQLRARSQKFLQEEELSYQAVALPGGLVTPGQDRGYLLQAIFGDDFTGKSFFDIGSHLGYFCIEALRRGAARSCGIETYVANIRQAQRIADLWSLKPEYILGNFEQWDSGGETFDVVACLNVLHHLFDPIHAIQKMSHMARSHIVLEVARPTWRDVMKYGINPLRLIGLGAPAIFLGKSKNRGFSAGRTYLFTPQALTLMLNVHTNMFEPVSVTESPFKGRLVIVARKRSIGHLVVVAGPTSSGKSTLVARLREDAGVRQQFGMASGDWHLVAASTAAKLAPGRHDQLIFHYDFLRPSRSGMRSHDRDPAMDLLKVAEKVTIITIVTQRDRMAEQLQKGEIEREGRKPRERDLELLRLYGTPQFLNDWYAAWESFISTFPMATRIMVENRGEFKQVATDDVNRQSIRTSLLG